MRKDNQKNCSLCGRKMTLRNAQFQQKELCEACAYDYKKTAILKKYHSHDKQSRRYLFYANKLKFMDETRKGVEL